jgi:DNA-binding IclR family transcriptional regulator
MVLWHDEGCPVTEIAELAGTSRPTVYKWLNR